MAKQTAGVAGVPIYFLGYTVTVGGFLLKYGYLTIKLIKVVRLKKYQYKFEFDIQVFGI